MKCLIENIKTHRSNKYGIFILLWFYQLLDDFIQMIGIDLDIFKIKN